eukprot:CAMPEP_0202809266 /NCGR_PEP_ID=MMETSP1389-20130828/1613_1 /ASSEMBLY_ACC=CAM_ASM_000865 /TAXON_ID=302021 /ORGANISM="Rhodomonas sp., Strain CCMP768" /LENGTH=84 /DNA_ID=CAMNT_0049479823 /DNA_START=108 /DNA_END=363 /DNA_ORIENTATION=-
MTSSDDGIRVSCSFSFHDIDLAQFNTLYGKKAAALYTQAGDYQKTARFYYKKAEDTYYQANNWAAYDDWRRARDQWDYFYSRNR